MQTTTCYNQYSVGNHNIGDYFVIAQTTDTHMGVRTRAQGFFQLTLGPTLMPSILALCLRRFEAHSVTLIDAIRIGRMGFRSWRKKEQEQLSPLKKEKEKKKKEHLDETQLLSATNSPDLVNLQRCFLDLNVTGMTDPGHLSI